ncbi:tumor necrosis factor receptor superfamily member 1B-like [Sceloporus undulatus]|uniref:tumor necrosis factor receptor superfamily member 1B-like n=1 Tax=Sceloporus undulatus TaxID=8520 RepID=UPI001C4DA70E|nr:tumor necrosis factor receptor superfamily member 1B-like [Sceloporus undulatus]
MGLCPLRTLLQILLCLSQVSSLPYTPQIHQRCQNPQTEHYVEAIDRCCRSCPPGSRVQRRCNESMDTQCIECEEGMFTPAWSRAERCFSCIPPCKAGFVEVKECTRTQDRFCWCRSHQFCAIKLSQSCLQCVEHHPCAKGSGVVKPGTGTSNVQCAPCDPGTFSDVESATALCKPHKKCKSILVPGNSTNDALCSDPNDGPIDAVTHAPHNSVTSKRNTKLPPLLSVTGDPMLDIKQDASGDISSLAGWLAGVTFLAVALIVAALLCLAFRKKDRDCSLPCAKEKQPFSFNEKGLGSWVPDASALGQEEQNLLQISASSSSGSLENPAGSDSGISNAHSVGMETEGLQQRFAPSNGRLHHGGANLEQAGGGGETRVNVSCVVSVCGTEHSLRFQPANGLHATHPRPRTFVEDEDLPLSTEESPEEKDSSKQIAVEVEDSMDVISYGEEKPPPLSVQDAGMKAA